MLIYTVNNECLKLDLFHAELFVEVMYICSEISACFKHLSHFVLALQHKLIYKYFDLQILKFTITRYIQFKVNAI